VRQEGPHEDQSGEALEEMIAKLIAEIEGSGELEQSERNTETKIKDRNMTAREGRVVVEVRSMGAVKSGTEYGKQK
jgi:hypothetical protein